MSEAPQAHEAGRRRPTIRDVARHAGVSKSLVSLVLRDSPRVSDKSREAVEQSIRLLGYRPSATARSLVSGRSGLIGIVTTNLLDFFYFEVIEGVWRHLHDEEGELFPLLIRSEHTPASEHEAVERFLELQVEGLILMGTHLSEETVESIAGEIPLAVVGQHMASHQVDVIVTDDVRGAELASRHLLDLGHRRLAHLAGAGNGAPEREQGFRQTVDAAGVEPVVIPAGYDVDGGFHAMSELLRTASEPPTAVFAANDLSAIGVMNAIRATGRSVPDDISVIGFDDIALAGWQGIELTTINQPTREMGELAARLITARITGSKAPQQVLIEPALVIRSTTVPA